MGLNFWRAHLVQAPLWWLRDLRTGFLARKTCVLVKLSRSVNLRGGVPPSSHSLREGKTLSTDRSTPDTQPPDGPFGGVTQQTIQDRVRPSTRLRGPSLWSAIEACAVAVLLERYYQKVLQVQYCIEDRFHVSFRIL